MKKPLTDHTRRLLCWIPAAFLSAICIAVSLLWLDARYALNDDAAILRAFLGCEGGAVADFLPHQHELITIPLGFLNRQFPGIPFFSYLQVFLLWLGFTVIFKLPLQLTQHHKTVRIFSCGMVTALFGIMALYVCARITYTQTAAVLVAAAAAELLSLNPDNDSTGVIVRCMLFSLFLFCLGYGLRLEILPAGLAFLGLCWLFQDIRIKKKNPKNHSFFCFALILCATVVGVLFLQRQIRISQPDVKEYMDWHKVRISVLDYHALNDLPQDLLDEIGWDKTTVSLVQECCFLPPEVNTEALTKIQQYYQAQAAPHLFERLTNGLAVLRDNLFSEQTFPLDRWPVFAFFSIALLSLFFILFEKHERKEDLLLWICTTLLCLTLLFYLALQGRMPFRAVYTVILSGTVLYTMLMCRALQQISSRVPCIILCIASVIAGTCCTALNFKILPVSEEAVLEVGDPATYLDEYAAYDESTLYLYDYTLSGIENRLFPQSIDGLYPQNVAFFGGWRMFSSGSIQQFGNYGLDLMNRENDLLLSENLIIATGVCEPLVPALTAWLQAHVDSSIEPMIWGEDGGIYYICFQ